ncbi:hypothetical protein E4U54_006599, partial [Claviceps lovelessii]
MSHAQPGYRGITKQPRAYPARSRDATAGISVVGAADICSFGIHGEGDLFAPWA